jgi:GT2 family glycosyltransferase
MIEIVSATRLSATDFAARSALGQSLRRLASFDLRVSNSIAYENRRGLPEIFNARIRAADSPEFLVFMHDDVWIEDHFFTERVIAGLHRFDVIGVAGNRRRVAHQPSWAFIDLKLTWDDQDHLSGAIGHGTAPLGRVSYFGQSGAECELLDGVLLGARKSALRSGGILFDPQFDFHFYDLDFCRSARQAGLKLGTWPICITHQSDGAFGSEPWKQKYQAYLGKWGN